MEKKEKIRSKNIGQVFTPQYLVEEMLDYAGYKNTAIIEKHIIDNSCGDGAFLQVYRWMYKTQNCSEKAVTAKCKKWKPYSSVASRFCYKALDAGMTKEEFHLFK